MAKVAQQKTSDSDVKNTDTKYARGIYNDNENKDYTDQSDLNSPIADINEGLGDDAYGTYDIDDSTLPAENDEDVTETGIQVEDADNLDPAMEKLGDVIVDDKVLD